MERRVAYDVDDLAPGWDRIIESRLLERWRQADLEMVLTYVPEAEFLTFNTALKIARERDEEAADRLRLDFIQSETI